MAAELEELLVADQDAWRSWLSANHERTHGVRLVLAKKGTVEPTSISYDEALDVALCFGWIDGQVGRRNEATFLQRFTPRRARSPWSKRNVGLAARLIEEGLMHASGHAEIERAKADGRWEAAYAGAATIEAPPELLDALAASPPAKAMYEALSGQNRYAILYRLATVKRAETRTRKIVEFVAMLERGETIHPQKRRST